MYPHTNLHSAQHHVSPVVLVTGSLDQIHSPNVVDDTQAEGFTKLKSMGTESVALESPISKRWSFFLLLGFFSVAISVLYVTYTSFPALEE